MSDPVQEVVALVIVVGAATYIVHHVTGWPTWRRKPKGQPVVLGERLRRGLEKAKKR